MSATPATLGDNRFTLGGILILAFLIGWLSGLKNLVLEQTATAESEDNLTRPNILLIVADDLGYNDTDAINPGGLHTPNINALAREGVTFTRHYADATCTPSRVGILTGRDPERSGFRPVGIEIPDEYPTLAEALTSLGYATYLTGKWHAGEERLAGWPQNKGFERWFGFLNQWETAGPVTEANKGVRKPTYHDPMLRRDGGELTPHPGHLTDLLTEHTLEQLAALQNSKQPWFLYHAFLAPHHPVQPEARYAERFPDTPEGRYTALVTQLDEAVGRILAAVEDDNTLVVFLSDNGGTNAERDNNYPFYGKKAQTYEGSYRTPLIMAWPGEFPAGKTVDDIVMNVGIFPTLLTAAGGMAMTDLDGRNLLPLVQRDVPLSPRSRSWEVYGPNIGALSFGFLEEGGRFRLSAEQSFPPGLYDLASSPAGDADISAEATEFTGELTNAFWQQQRSKGMVPVVSSAGALPGQTLYSGFDTLRSPFRFGFAIGLELGPLDEDVTASGSAILAEQQPLWSLHYREHHGLEWHIGDSVLASADFEPNRCNRIVLTGYFQPKAHLAKRDPLSQVKLYSNGALMASERGFDHSLVSDTQLDAPTTVNAGGRALFANLMLGTFTEGFSPRLAPEHQAVYHSLYEKRQLPLPELAMLDDQLCR